MNDSGDQVGEGVLVDVGTRFVIEVRRPIVGEWIVLPGPLWTMVNARDILLDQECTVIVGLLQMILNDAAELVYRVVPLFESGRFPPQESSTEG